MSTPSIYRLLQLRKEIDAYLESVRRSDVPNRTDICVELTEGPLSFDELRNRWRYPLDQSAHGKALECLNIGLVKLNKERRLELVK